MQATSEPYLTTRRGGKRTDVPLKPGAAIHIGRSASNPISIPDNQVSRRHAMVHCNLAGDCFLTDLGSRNGTYVNDRRVTAPVSLQPGDRISIGGHEIRFEGPAARGPATEAPTTTGGETMLDAAPKLVTVLVADIRDFTGLSRRVEESRLSGIMSTLFRHAGAILSEHGATGQKYIGDAVMAFWVHPEAPPSCDDLLNILAALRRLFKEVDTLHGQYDLPDPVRIGAGLNTGFAWVGNLGSAAASDFTALSDAVNLSFRLETATKRFGCDVAIGSTTASLLAEETDVAKLFERHTVTLKGYDVPVEACFGSREDLEGLLSRRPGVGAAAPPPG